ncbi:MAG TPA: ribonuclease P protein component [Turneriella sp.]|nr:ribonuclease P protein component [Turneriella sp.]HNE18458.1 ribonuclease P protein component [Turneriella sp.]HNJ67487.1 ribonuclease P protein component [Turneriella sp.]HNL09839.1 ribonuclease P protein component [Turneriella sp.]HNL55653.1 ribonuclease P protein component [Turneriella sp.]
MSETPIPLKRSRYFTSLKLKNRIDHLFKNGRKSFGRYLMLRFDNTTDTNPPLRVVFAVSSRLGPATVRNRIKRRLREALFLTLKEGRSNPAGFDIAIVPRKEVAELDFSELCDDLRQALRRMVPAKNTGHRK